MVSKKMMFMNAQLFWTGASIAFWSGMLTPIMFLQQKDSLLSVEEKESRALFCMIAFGFGDVISGIIMGVIIDRLGS